MVDLQYYANFCCKVTQSCIIYIIYIHNIHINYFSFPFFFRAAPSAYGCSRARGQIRPTAAGLSYSHSNTGSKPHLQPPLQLTATPDRQPTEQGQGIQPTSSWILVGFLSTVPQWELPLSIFPFSDIFFSNSSIFFCIFYDIIRVSEQCIT